MVKFFSLAAVLLALAACTDDEPRLAEQTSEIAVGNGVSLNGVSLNGVSLNGVSLNGVSLNGVSLNGVSLNGVSLDGVSLDGTTLSGTSLDGVPLAGVPAVGASFTGLLSSGARLELRLDRALRGLGANADVWMYGMSYASDAGWHPLCGLDAAGAPILALAVDGTWNTAGGVPDGGAYTASTQLATFACRGKTIAKCVELGYKPWTGHTDHLLACVRLLRGDFCGDGTAHTQDGNLVNLYDALGVQVDTESWSVEAEWTPAGARCVNPGNTRWDFIGAPMPECLQDRARKGCGTFNKGALLIDELPLLAEPAQPTLSTKTSTLRLR